LVGQAQGLHVYTVVITLELLHQASLLASPLLQLLPRHIGEIELVLLGRAHFSELPYGFFLFK
jgi:hypothetical protein